MPRRRISLTRPLDLGGTLSMLFRGRRDPTTRLEQRELWRACRTPAGVGTLHLRHEGAHLDAEAWGPGADWLLARAPDLVGESDDDAGFVAHHGVVQEMRRRNRGIRLGRTGLVLDALVPSILEQKVTSVEAWRSYAALVRRYGDRAPGPRPLWAPPSAATLASLPSWDYHRAGVEQRRANTIKNACARAGRVEEAAAMTPADAAKRLMALPGVGVWTAAEVTRNALGDPDAVSVGDFNLKNVVAWALAGEPRATDDRMLELLEPYRGQRARAIRYIESSGLRPPRYGPRMPLRNIAAI